MKVATWMTVAMETVVYVLVMVVGMVCMPVTVWISVAMLIQSQTLSLTMAKSQLHYTVGVTGAIG